jgi:hypothetical protein
MRKRRIILWIGGGLTVIFLLLIIAIPLAQEPLRRHLENNMNERLEGYSVQLGGLAYRPISTMILRDIRIFQNAHPDPPVADIPNLRASLHWREVLRARLVADFNLDNPRLHLNLDQLREEMTDDRPVEERGWQEAIQSVYPFKVNVIRIRGGNLVYIDEDPEQPLQLDEIFFEASNIRNIDSPEASYPSPVFLESIIFGEGRIIADGHADFLQEPYLGINIWLELTGIPIDPLRPVFSRYNFFVREGELAATGNIVHSPTEKLYEFDSVEISEIHLDYRYPGSAPEEQENDKTEAGKEAVTADPPEEAGKEEILYLVKDLYVNGSIGMVNTETDPSFRIFLDPLDLRVNRLSNNFQLGEARVELSGMFMGSGRTEANVVLRPEETGPDFDLNLTIEETHMPAMNDLLLAYGGFDVSAGKFSLEMEVHVENQQVDGYVEPFFRDITVLDPDQDKNFLQQLYEGLIEVLTNLLENVPRDEIATRADISGELDDPEASIWQIVVNLIRNAFVEAIIPQFAEDAEE